MSRREEFVGVRVIDHVTSEGPCYDQWLTDEPIVRCQDCENYSEHEWVMVTDVSDVCHFWHGEPTKVEPDGFCAWGKLREVD